jgi:hypothetical protein
VRRQADPQIQAELSYNIEMALSATWNLDRTGSTANELFGVGKAIFQTAYRDTIQPFALHACEKFGSTIAMSAETRRKLNQEVCTPIQPRTFKFVKSISGPAGGESLHALSLSIAGQNFLGLVTGLVSVMGTFEAAAAIEIMMINTARDLIEVSAQLYIRQILDVVEPRLNRLKFLDKCHEWSRILKLPLVLAANIPTPMVLINLCQHFGQLVESGKVMFIVLSSPLPLARPG